MKCQHCGHELPAGSKFCEYCGTPLAAPQARQPVRPVQPQYIPMPQPQNPKKWYYVGGILAIIVAIGIGFGLSTVFKADPAPAKPAATAAQAEPVTNTQQASTPTETAPQTGFKTYTNARYGFRIDYPADFIKGNEPTNGDGIGFASPNHEASLRASAGHAITNQSVRDQYEQDLRQVRGQVGYHDCGDTWYVITWSANGNLYYRKTNFKNQIRSEFEFVFPEGKKDIYSPIIDHIESTFIPGNKN